MNLYFKGIVTLGDPYREKHHPKQGFIWIGECDVLAIVDEYFRNQWIWVKLNEKFYYGKVLSDLGFGFSSYPKEPDFLWIGSIDLLERLKHYYQQEVCLVMIKDGGLRQALSYY